MVVKRCLYLCVYFQVPRFVGRADCDMMHKLVDLQGFNLYWDVDTQMVGDLPFGELSVSFKLYM